MNVWRRTVLLGAALCWLSGFNAVSGEVSTLGTPEAFLPSLAIDQASLSGLAIQEHGRKKPFTTFAQEALLRLCGRSSLKQQSEGGQGDSLTAEQVILSLWLTPEGWEKRPLIFEDNDEMRQALRLTQDHDVRLFSYEEVAGKPELVRALQESRQLRSQDHMDEVTPLQKEAEALQERLDLFDDIRSGQLMAIIPHPTLAEERWGVFQTPEPEEATKALGALIPTFEVWRGAFRAKDMTAFNELTVKLTNALRAFSPNIYPSAGALAFEYHYMTFHPFLWAWITDLLTIFVLLTTAVWMKEIGYKLTWLGVVIGLGFEIYGLACRVIIAGRPPVTDMYETVIWVSVIVMATAVVMEAIYRSRYFFYAGIPASVIALIIADTQPLVLDASIHPLTAVLRSNYWLIIHVLTIVSAYGAFLLAAALGHIALGMEMVGRAKKRDLDEAHLYIYRAMQVGVLLLTTGTILGGVWANYSWGRFWGWDPKEVWALVTLLCYLAVLHGRIAGVWKGRGLAFGSVICWFSVLMSWYGVNYVLPAGKSLHGYGAGTGGFSSVLGYSLGELIFVIFAAVWLGVLRVGEKRVTVSTSEKKQAKEALA